MKVSIDQNRFLEYLNNLPEGNIKNTIGDKLDDFRVLYEDANIIFNRHLDWLRLNYKEIVLDYVRKWVVGSNKILYQQQQPTEQEEKQIADSMITHESAEYKLENTSKDENLLSLPLYKIDGEEVFISGNGGVTSELDINESNGTLHLNGCGVLMGVYMSINRKIKHSFSSCKQQGCPVCFRHWAHIIGKKSASYQWAIHEKIRKRDTKSRLSHITFSRANSDNLTKKILQKEIKKLERISLEYSIRKETMFSVVRHPYRLQKECLKCNTIQSSRNNTCEKCGSKYDPERPEEKVWSANFWVKGFHIHVISNLFILKEKMSEFNQKVLALGWKFVNISANKTEKEDKYISSEEILKSIISYELGHAMFYKERQTHAITYMAYSNSKKWIVELEKKKEEVLDKFGDPFYKIKYSIKDFSYVSNIPTYVISTFHERWLNPHPQFQYITLQETSYIYTIKRKAHQGDILSMIKKLEVVEFAIED